jgi:2-polyprenyl-3-methyl-5-hydroxy-6-metoxy-1,4-benzoquinol methylase
LEQTFANTEVLDFYKEFPFNYLENVESHVLSIRDHDLSDYPSLVPLLSDQTRVLDVGCGTGWLGMSIAYHYHAHVTGIDLNPVGVERAREINSELDLKMILEVEDLFTFKPKSLFDVVVSLGVLHHTNDCHAAIRKLCTTFVVPDGHVFIGLYHKYVLGFVTKCFTPMKLNTLCVKSYRC